MLSFKLLSIFLYGNCILKKSIFCGNITPTRGDSMVTKKIDLSYILGTVLLSRGIITYEDLCKITSRMRQINKSYNIDDDYNTLLEVVDEWRDFFYIDPDDISVVKFTKQANTNRDITSTVFTSMIDDDVYIDIHKSIKFVNEGKKLHLTIFKGE